MTNTTKSDASVLETIREVVDNATAGRVFGTPISQNGLTVLPVAKVSSGGGGGGGTGPAEQGQETGGTGGTGGAGGGMGVSAKPLGVFVIKNGSVSWRPAIDVNRVILGGQVVAIVALLVIRSLVRGRRRSADA